MKLYEIFLKLRSPAIVSARKTERGYLSPLRYIPSSTLRGAIISHLYREGRLDEENLRRETSNPRIIASPAYPMQGGERSYPCHPFAYICKIPDCGETKNYAYEALEALEADRRPTLRSTCGKGHLALKTLHPNPVIPRDGGIVGVKEGHHWSVSIGMSRDRASSQRGLLFEYEALGVGLEFWATIAIPDELAEALHNGAVIRIGRGVSRGFGEAEITKRRMSIEEEAGRVAEAMRGRRLILYALSPVSEIRGGESTPLPGEIELSRVAENLNIEANGRIKFREAFGRITRYHTGWDMRRGIMRPKLNASQPGSIFTADVEGGENIAEAIAALRFIGTIERAGDYPIVGLNLLTPLRGHPMEGG